MSSEEDPQVIQLDICPRVTNGEGEQGLEKPTTRCTCRVLDGGQTFCVAYAPYQKRAVKTRLPFDPLTNRLLCVLNER